MRLRWLPLLALPLFAGCGLVYKLDNQQGNLFDEDTVEAVRPGMSKRQVLLVLGTPAVISPFDQDRWDYVSTRRLGRSGKLETRNLVLQFDGDTLASIEGDYFPEDPDELIRQARKYKRDYPDEKQPDEDSRPRDQD